MKYLKQRYLFIILVFCFAFSIRFIYFFQMQSLPTKDYLPKDMDSYLYDQRAQEITKGEWVKKSDQHPIYVNPIYPYFLAGIYKLFGRDLNTVRIMQFLLGSIGVVIIYLIAKTVYSHRIGIIAAFLAAVYPTLVFFESLVLISALTIFLVELSLLFLVRANSANKHSFSFQWFLAGFLVAVVTLAQAQLQLFIPVVVLWCFFSQFTLNTIKSFKQRLISAFKPLAALLFGLFIVLLPNYIIQAKNNTNFALAGIHFYIGNNPTADGMLTTPPNIRPNPMGHALDAEYIAEKEMKSQLTPKQVSFYWINKSMDFLKNRPKAYFELQLKKLALFWKDYTIPNNENILFFKHYIPLLNLLIISFGLIAPLGIVGAILSIKNWKKSLILYLFLLVQMITVVLFFITARYRLPVVVPLFIFSAYALVWIYECAQKQKFFKAGLTLGLFSILFIFVNTGLPGTRIKRDLAKAYFDLGFYQKSVNKNDMAIKAYRKAIEIDSSLSMAHNNLGNLLKNKGDMDSAYQAFQKAIQYNPYNYRAYNNLGILLYQTGKAKEALAKFEHALAIKPDYQIAKRNMMFVQKKLNGLEK